MKFRRGYILSSLVICLSSLSIWPIYSYSKVLSNNESPQLILVLGGDTRREHEGAYLAKQMDLPIIISGGSNPEYANWVMDSAGIDQDKLTLDYRAKDTLENFTSLVDEFESKAINHAILITSKDHIFRAMIIGQIVAGSRGIRLTSKAIECKPECNKEALDKIAFDLIRAVVWVVSKQDPKKVIEAINSKNIYSRKFNFQ